MLFGVRVMIEIILVLARAAFVYGGNVPKRSAIIAEDAQKTQLSRWSS
jgi:hypothetical protein